MKKGKAKSPAKAKGKAKSPAKTKGKGVKGGASVKVDSVASRGREKVASVNDVSFDGETASVDSDMEIPMDMGRDINIVRLFFLIYHGVYMLHYII